jgi:hypothetical protein
MHPTTRTVTHALTRMLTNTMMRAITPRLTCRAVLSSSTGAHWRLALLVWIVAACEHPIAVVSPHVEAQDLIVRDTSGTLLVRTLDNTRWSDSILAVPLDDSMPVRVRLVDFRGAEFDLAARPEYSIRLQAEQAAMVQWEPLRDRGVLRGFQAGVTRVRFQVWHTDHPDFISPWLTVRVQPRG